MSNVDGANVAESVIRGLLDVCISPAEILDGWHRLVDHRFENSLWSNYRDLSKSDKKNIKKMFKDTLEHLKFLRELEGDFSV
jgi:hypothetical protein